MKITLETSKLDLVIVGKTQSNVVVKIMIEEWVAKLATDFTFGRVDTKRIEKWTAIISTKTTPTNSPEQQFCFLLLLSS